MEENKCSNGCHRYNKTMDEVIQATSKHRDAALALKHINEKQKNKISWYRDQLISMQSQIDKLEFDFDVEKDAVMNLQSDKKVLEENVKTLQNSTEGLTILKEELKEEIEKLKTNKESSDESTIKLENCKLQRKVTIYDNIMKELENKVEESKKQKKELQETIRLLNLANEEDHNALEKEIDQKSDEIFQLVKNLDDLKAIGRDQKEEIHCKDLLIFDMKNELEIKDHSTSNFSCESLADEMDVAKNLEKVKLEHEVEQMKTKITRFEKSKERRQSHIAKLEEISKKRCEELAQLQISIEKIKPERRPNCSYGWKCRRGRMCRFDHSFLYTKVNKHHRKNPSDKLEIIQLSCLCEVCGKNFECEDMFEMHGLVCVMPSLFTVDNLASDKDLTIGKEQSELKKNQNEPKCLNNSSNIKGKYHCEECHIMLKSRSKFRNHQQNVHKQDEKIKFVANSRFPCQQCSKQMSSKKQLKRHNKQSCSREIMCQECELDFLTMDELVVHIGRNHEENEVVNTKSETNVSVQHNEKEFHGEFKCEVCKLDFGNIEDLDKHMDESHVENLKCELCNINFEKVKNMDSHMDEKHGGRWKMNDPDILREGDDESSSDFSCDSFKSEDN